MIGSNLTGVVTNFATAEGNVKKQARLEEQKQREQNEIKAKYADKQFTIQVTQVAVLTLAMMNLMIDLFKR